jgi:hypothetical protein
MGWCQKEDVLRLVFRVYIQGSGDVGASRSYLPFQLNDVDFSLEWHKVLRDETDFAKMTLLLLKSKARYQTYRRTGVRKRQSAYHARTTQLRLGVR